MPSALCGWRSDVLPSSRSFQGLNRLHPRTAGGAPLVSGAASGLAARRPANSQCGCCPLCCPTPRQSPQVGNSRLRRTRRYGPVLRLKLQLLTATGVQRRTFKPAARIRIPLGAPLFFLQDCTVLSSPGSPAQTAMVPIRTDIAKRVGVNASRVRKVPQTIGERPSTSGARSLVVLAPAARTGRLDYVQVGAVLRRHR